MRLLCRGSGASHVNKGIPRSGDFSWIPVLLFRCFIVALSSSRRIVAEAGFTPTQFPARYSKTSSNSRNSCSGGGQEQRVAIIEHKPLPYQSHAEEQGDLFRV